MEGKGQCWYRSFSPASSTERPTYCTQTDRSKLSCRREHCASVRSPNCAITLNTAPEVKFAMTGVKSLGPAVRGDRAHTGSLTTSRSMVGVPNPGTEFRGASTVTFLRMPAVGQPCPVFMWCRTVDIGAHHACWLVLQTLFMTASVPTATSTTATRRMTRRFSILTSRPRLLTRRIFVVSECLAHPAATAIRGSNDFDRPNAAPCSKQIRVGYGRADLTKTTPASAACT